MLFRYRKKEIINEALHRLGVKEPSLFRQRHSIHFLNVAQSLGAINDNAFKYFIVFLFIAALGQAYSATILFWAGIVYVTPFLLFSNLAGLFADRFSKQKILVYLKFTEILITAAGIVAFALKSAVASYTLLFFLSLQSALFGPPKYSIILELTDRKNIGKANGLIAGSTYLAIIIGTFLASLITQVTNKNFPFAAFICTIIAIFGYISSLCIPLTPPQKNNKKMSTFFLYDIYKTLKKIKPIPFLLTSLFGAATFLFIGAYFQLNIVIFSVEALHLSPEWGGYLFFITSVGIVLGALISGKLSKKRPEIGISCVSGLFFVVLTFLLAIFGKTLITAATFLFVIGFFGGLFIVPFDTFIQTQSPPQDRGQIVAVSNFLSFCGVLLAPICIYLFYDTLKLQSASGFALIGLIFLCIVCCINSQLANWFFNKAAQICLWPFYKLSSFDPSPEKGLSPLLLSSSRFRCLLLVAASHPHIHFCIVRQSKQKKDIWLKQLSCIHFFYPFQSTEEEEKLLSKIQRQEGIPCFLKPPSPKILQRLQKTPLQILEITQEKKHFFGRAHVRFTTHHGFDAKGGS